MLVFRLILIILYGVFVFVNSQEIANPDSNSDDDSDADDEDLDIPLTTVVNLPPESSTPKAEPPEAIPPPPATSSAASQLLSILNVRPRQDLSDDTFLVRKIDNSNNVAQSNSDSKSTSNSQEKKPRPAVVDEELMVRTKNGIVRGKAVYLDYHLPNNQKKNNKLKKRVNTWLGIPYAEKPIRDLRFKRTVPVKNWSGVYNATKLQNTCFQLPDDIYPGFWGTELWNPNTQVSEDCLYLNVWTPNPKPRNSPVMVKIV